MPPRKSVVGGSGAKPSSKASSVPSSARARKNAAPAAGARTARKHVSAARESTAGSDEDEDQLRSSPRRKSTTESPSSIEEEDVSTEEEVDVQASLLAPRSKSGRDNAPASVNKTSKKDDKAAASSKKAPVSEGKSVRNAKKAAAPRQTKRKSTAGTTEESDDEGERARTVRSTSARGYTWDAEKIDIKPEDLDNILKKHPVIKTTLERNGIHNKVKFKPGNLVFVLPDPSYLPPRSEEIDQSELADDDWWVAEIDSCYSLPQEGDADLGVLKVTWWYSKDDVPKLSSLHSDYNKKLLKYRMDDDERISSDHYDFIGIDSYAGDASGMYSYLTLQGLAVPDEERLKAPHMRLKQKRPKICRLTGWEKKKSDNNAKYYASLDVNEDHGETQNSRGAPASSASTSRGAPASRKAPASGGATKKRPSATAGKSSR